MTNEAASHRHNLKEEHLHVFGTVMHKKTLDYSSEVLKPLKT